MVESRGGVTGGASIADFLASYERLGFQGQFVVRDRGRIDCTHCGAVRRAKDYLVHGMRRVEGVSDPGDMSAVLALECPACAGRGTATLTFGPLATAEDGQVLRELDQRLRPSRQAWEEAALGVRDSGWLR